MRDGQRAVSRTPFACTVRSGMRSRFWWRAFRAVDNPASTAARVDRPVKEFWLSAMGLPAVVVIKGEFWFDHNPVKLFECVQVESGSA